MSKIIELKIWPVFFDAVVRGIKTFEVRKDDRDFQLGDTIKLREWNPVWKIYTGDETTVVITYILRNGSFGIEEGYCVMGIKRTS